MIDRMNERTNNIFCIRREERLLALLLIVLLVSINAMVIAHYYNVFTPIQSNYWNLFIGKFHISGFDPITLSVVSDWSAGYNVYRHPLLAFFMYPAYLLNQLLMSITGIHRCCPADILGFLCSDVRLQDLPRHRRHRCS